MAKQIRAVLEVGRPRLAHMSEFCFLLLCDEDHAVAEAFGVWGEKSMYGKTYMGIVRSAFLIDEKGKLEGVWYKVSPKDTVPNVKGMLT